MGKKLYVGNLAFSVNENRLTTPQEPKRNGRNGGGRGGFRERY